MAKCSVHSLSSRKVSSYSRLLQQKLKEDRKMKKMILFIVSCLATINMFGFTQNDRILGKWINENQTRIIEFVKTNHGYDAYIKYAENKSLNGHIQIEGLRPSSPNLFLDGTVFLFSRNKKIKCQAHLEGDKRLYITGKYGFVSKTQLWKKYQ